HVLGRAEVVGDAVLAAVVDEQHVDLAELGAAVRARERSLVDPRPLGELARLPVRPLDRPRNDVLEAAEDGPPRPGGLVGAESVVGAALGPAPRARLGRGGLHPSPPAQTDWPGAGCCGVAPTRRHWVILPSWITKLVSAFSPTPPAQLPGPGRSVSSKVAVV